MINLSKYKAVFFDLYGTLVQIENPISPYREIMKLCNLGDSDKQKFKTLAMSTKLSIDEICREFGVSLGVDTKNKFEADIELELKSIVIKQDTNDILKKAKALGLKTAIISNLAKEYGQASHLFDVDLRVLSFEVGMLKPSPEIFQFALEHLGFEAKDCLMIGDNDELDLEPFEKLGGDTHPVNITYYSGTTAINLYSSKNTGGWHAVEAVKAINSGESKSPYFLAGSKREVNTIPYLGTKGIINCESILKRMGANPKQKYKFAANHYRAVADMALWSALNAKSLDFIAINDWMVKKTDRQKVYALLKTSYKKLNRQVIAVIDTWIKKVESVA